jgi:uncharacterized protein YndB with AHSA1/START domain
MVERVPTPSGEFTLALTRVLPAARPVVFGAFSDPTQLAKWWGPEGFTTPSLGFQPCVGRRYRIEMQPPEADRFYLAGEFLEFERPAHLAFSFVWEDPDPDDVETVACLSFRDLGEATEVALSQGPFKTQARLALHRDGWTDSLDKLEHILSVRT